MILKKISQLLVLNAALHGVAAVAGWNRSFTFNNELDVEMVTGTWLLDKALLKDERLQKQFLSSFRKIVHPPDSFYLGSEFIMEDFSDVQAEAAENIVEEFNLSRTNIKEKYYSGKQSDFRIRLSKDTIEKMNVIRASNGEYLGYFIPINSNYLLRYLPGSCGDRIEGFYRK